MGKENSQQRFAEAKRLYGEGNYAKALLHLRKLDDQYPDVFNIQHPIMQCLQHLERMSEVKELHKKMLAVHLDEKHQAKLNRVGRWIKRTEQKTTPSKGYSKDGQIESDFGDEIEEVGKAIRDRVEKEERKDVSSEKDVASDVEPDALVQEQDEKSEKKAVKKKFPVVRKILIAVEVLLIVVIGMSVMFFLVRHTTRVLPEFTADVVMEVNDTQITGKLYLKNTDTFRMEIMEQTFVASNGQMRKILTEEEQYINVNPADIERYNPLVGLSNFGDWVRMNNAKKVGKEMLQEFACDIYQADVEAAKNEPSMSTKVWYCRQIKFPLKSENTAFDMQDGEVVTLGKVSVTLKNIQIEEPLPAEKFEVPSVYAEFVKKKEKEPDPDKLDALPDNMEALLEAGDPTALLMQFQ